MRRMHFPIQYSPTHSSRKPSLRAYYTQAASRYSRKEVVFEYFKVEDNLRRNDQKLLEHRFPRKIEKETQKKISV